MGTFDRSGTHRFDKTLRLNTRQYAGGRPTRFTCPHAFFLVLPLPRRDCSRHANYHGAVLILPDKREVKRVSLFWKLKRMLLLLDLSSACKTSNCSAVT